MARPLSAVLALSLTLVVGVSAIRLVAKEERKAALSHEERAMQWTSSFYGLLDGSLARYDEHMAGCCDLANQTGIRPHEHFGDATAQQINWWKENDCNRMVGAQVLPVGTPLCQQFKFMKKAFVGVRNQEMEFSESLSSCSVSDRQVIDTVTKNPKPTINLAARPECAPSQLVKPEAKGVQILNFASCLQTMYTGVSTSCSMCYSNLLDGMVRAKDYGSGDKCLDMCTEMEGCWGLEKCVRRAGNCTRCLERVTIKHKACVGGDLHQTIDAPAILRKMMGFWTHFS
mmetsp:Transcript_7830/g.24937  ORF Transcript_7830/g.24937 Transcript_7830/m.24937 type:complete len:286 (-) Transcript_7830:49-906(-)